MAEYKTRLRELRESKGKTQQEAADDLNYSLRSYQEYERGNTSIPQNDIERIAWYFGATSDYLFCLSNEIQPQVKEFQEATGLSESAIANISKYKNITEIMSCINQFLSSAEFINAIGSIAIAKAPSARIPTKEDMTESVVHGAELFQIATGQKKIITNEKVVLKGKDLKEWELWQASQSINKLIDRIMKGDKEDGTR